MGKESTDPAYKKLKDELNKTGTIKTHKIKGGTYNWQFKQVKLPKTNNVNKDKA